MSQENALAFLKTLDGDPTLRNKMQALEPNDYAGVTALAREAGFAFSIEEWRAALTTIDSELDEAALDGVAGGALNAYLDTSAMGLADPRRGAGKSQRGSKGVAHESRFSEQDVVHFINKANVDSTLARQVRTLSSDDVAGVVRVAAQAGFAFTAEQWQHVSSSVFSDALSDAELDRVNGGANSELPPGPCIPNVEVWGHFLKL